MLVLADVHVETVHAVHVRGAGTADRSLEPVVARDDLVREYPAVAVTTDAEPLRVGDARLHDVIDRREHVGSVLVAPVGIDRVREFKAAP